MSMKYEGEGIMLNIDRIIRMVFAEGLEGDVRTSTELRETGRTSVFIRLDTLERSPWQHYDLSSARDEARQGWVIFIKDRSWKPSQHPQLVADVDEIADFEIVEDAPSLPDNIDAICRMMGMTREQYIKWRDYMETSAPKALSETTDK